MSYRPLKTGLATPTATASTVFTLPHGLGCIPAWCGVTPGNVLSASLFDVNWDNTNITVTYLTSLSGALSLYWIAQG